MARIDFGWFCEKILSSPWLLITFTLTLGVVFVNGWTDAPNAIATCVATRCISPKKAVILSALFNFIGVVTVTSVNAGVAFTVKNTVNLNGNSNESFIALTAALFSIILWAVAAWRFGIPTSESHALLAGLSGAAVALQNGFSGINPKEWSTVIFGLILSTVLGFFLGFSITKAVRLFFSPFHRRKTNVFFKISQIFGGCAMSFMHGAQDGQKFLGVMLLCVFLANGGSSDINTAPPLWMMLICSAVISVGTACGGYKIIKAVGMDMVRLERYQGFSADAAGAVCLLLSSAFGLPVSTTHTKTTALMGAGAAKRLSSVNIAVVKEMGIAWILTFPCCAFMGFFVTKLLLFIL